MEGGSPSRLYVTAKAPVNIAVIKYWGKRDEKLILPINSSLSTTLNMEDLCTITSVMASKSFPTDRLWLNGEEQDLNTQARMKRCIEELKRRATPVLSADGKEVIVDKESLQKDYHLHIVSRNNFPTAAGLASSAAGFACLAYSVAQVLGVQGELSELARLGSGSACRSVYGGFVKWNKGEQADGSDSIAVPVAEASHWPELQILICVVSDKKKGVSSTSGMETSTKTSELLKYRAEHIVEPRIKEMEDAIKARDFAKFGELTMKDSNQFHATCLDTYPPIFYMNDISKTIVHVISAFNKEAGTIKAAYTFDAGPNAVVYALKEDFPKLLKTLLYYFPPSENSTEEDFYGHFFEKKQVLADAGITSLEDVKNVTIDESLRGALRLDRQYGVLQKMIHTTVGPGPFVTPEEEGLINKETGLPL